MGIKNYHYNYDYIDNPIKIEATFINLILGTEIN